MNPEHGGDAPAPESLREALESIRLEGSIFLRGEYSEAWALSDQGGPGFAGMMHPGADRVILFHLLAKGRCWVTLADGVRHWADEGDVIVIPYGDFHTIGGVTPTEPVPITAIVEPPPWHRLPVVRHGEGGDPTDIVCGYLYSDDPLFDPQLRTLPPAFVVRPPGGPAAAWVTSSISYALDAPRIVSNRLPEAVLIEVLRLHLASGPASERGWIAALRDPVLAPALAQMHREPERRWTVEDIATGSAVSRSVLDERFRDVLGRSPIRYLTEWRMHLAKDMLSSTERTVASIARRVGYESEEAFSRAFKRAHGSAPSHWRASRMKRWQSTAPRGQR